MRMILYESINKHNKNALFWPELVFTRQRSLLGHKLVKYLHFFKYASLEKLT